MKIVHKIILANLFDILLIALTGLFAYQNLQLLLTKLRYVEIADDLNASFLEIRISEKNFFLYHDATELVNIHNKLRESQNVMQSEREDIIRAIGEPNYRQLEFCTQDYLEVINAAGEQGTKSGHLQARIREVGQRLREFADHITKLERANVNRIIAGSRNGLFISLVLILISALGVSQLVTQRILKSLKEIEKVAHAISEGTFRKVHPVHPFHEPAWMGALVSKLPFLQTFFVKKKPDELDSVMKAINSMSEELKQHEEMIIQSKKLASIGILTAGVAHELGNPLNNISMLAQAYAELYDDLSREDRIEYMQKVEEETERIRDIVKNLLDFSKPKKPNRVEASINTVIQKSLSLVGNMLQISNIDIDVHLAENLPQVLIDINQIQEVLINLITNAIQASSAGDKLRIRSGLDDAGEHIQIAIQDTGRGIPPEFLPHVFDPFFTTKEAGGTGLGLFVSYGIIQNHQGTIQVQSKMGSGTCFTIRLPVCRKEETG